MGLHFVLVNFRDFDSLNMSIISILLIPMEYALLMEEEDHDLFVQIDFLFGRRASHMKVQ